LFSGLVVQPELLSIVLKFKTYLISLTVDISRMYRRVFVYEEYRRYCGENLLKNPLRNMSSLQSHGTAPAAFLAT
jgi:hypothetical protein